MARRITGGLVGSSTLLGTIQISPDAAMSTAADQDITFSPGAGGLVVSTSAVQLNTQNDLRFADADSSNYVGFRSPPTVTINQIWTLPATDGAADQVLTTNSSGVLSWSSKSVVISNQTTSATIHYPLFTTSTSGAATGVNVSTTKLTYQPSTGTFRLLGNIASSSTTTGTLVVTGGVGVSGRLTVNNIVAAAAVTASNIVANGATSTMRAINPQTTNTYDLGTTALRWRNIYTQDLHLSNGIGDYTVIEGEEDLFLVNNKNGKSYKFALVEVNSADVPPKSEVN